MTAPGLKFGRYELRGELGWGGFATVYRAWDPALRREVALKALLPHLARETDLRRRFLAEAQALARLQHANIVPVYDVGETDGRPFFAMALIDGQTVAAMLTERKHLPLERVVELLHSLAAALDELHGQGLVHRDLKPQNVMLDRSGRVVLMDLGIARNIDSTTALTQEGTSLGTPLYMAPEQVRGQPAGPSADIYALGIFTFHLLADRPPFTGDTASVLHAQVYDAPPSLRDLRPGLPESVYGAIDAALAKDPADRPASARRFVHLLSDMSEAPTLPRPESAPTVVNRPVTAGSAEPISENGPTKAIGREGTQISVRLPGRRPLVAIAGVLILLLIAGTVAVVSRRSAPSSARAALSAVTATPRGPARPANTAQGARSTSAAANAGAQTAPSKDCAPVSLTPGETTVCSTFLDSGVPRGTTITESLAGPAGATIKSCRSESRGLTCSAPVGGNATITCTLDLCIRGAQFSVDVTASAPGALAERVIITAPGQTAQTFTFTGKATFR